MNLNKIKGNIEINNLSFDPKEIIKALIEQGIPVELSGEVLVIGRKTITYRTDLASGGYCQIAKVCRYYKEPSLNKKPTEDINIEEVETDITSQYRIDADQNIYIEEIPVEDFLSPIGEYAENNFSSQKNAPNNTRSSSSRNNGTNYKPTMRGVSIPSHYGVPSNNGFNYPIDPSYTGELSETGYCANCHKKVRQEWTFCGYCGYPLK